MRFEIANPRVPNHPPQFARVFPRVITLERSLREDCRRNVEISVKFRKGRDPWWYEFSPSPESVPAIPTNKCKKKKKKRKREKRGRVGRDDICGARPQIFALRSGGVVITKENNATSSRIRVTRREYALSIKPRPRFSQFFRRRATRLRTGRQVHCTRDIFRVFVSLFSFAWKRGKINGRKSRFIIFLFLFFFCVCFEFWSTSITRNQNLGESDLHRFLHFEFSFNAINT